MPRKKAKTSKTAEPTLAQLFAPPPPLEEEMGEACAARRARLAKKIGHGVVLLLSAPLARQSGDEHYFPYQPDNYLYYLTGCADAHTAYVMSAKNGRIDEEWFFCRADSAQMTQWEGPQLTTKTARKRLCLPDAVQIAAYAENANLQLAAIVRRLVAEHNKIYCLLGLQPKLDQFLANLPQHKRDHHRRCQTAGVNIMDLSIPLDAMRLIKDELEILLIGMAALITVETMTDAMQAARKLTFEYQVDAVISGEYRSCNAHHAFSPIVASGANACYLHYSRNDARINKNRLMLIDTGCRIHGYAGDVTRTFPVSGRWTPAQKAVYDIVLAAQMRALSHIRAGANWQRVEAAATRVLARGLAQLGLCSGSVATIIAKERYRRFFMHGLGHWLGLDVHDVGSMVGEDGRGAILKAGMVCTVEPGLYIPNESDIPRELRGIGIRIEDDVVVTRTGAQVLTEFSPKVPRHITNIINYVPPKVNEKALRKHDAARLARRALRKARQQ